MCLLSLIRFFLGILTALLLFVYHSIIFCLPYCCRRKKSLKDKVILITGTGSGIGRALAVELAKFDPVLILWSRRENTNLETEALIREKYGQQIRIQTTTIDVGNKEEVDRMAHEVKSEYGAIDILINNAGSVNGSYLTDLSGDEIKNIFDSNILSHYWTIQAFLPKMLEKNSGHIVAISSVAGVVGTSQLTDYSATKFAIVGLMESLDVELRNQNKDNVHVTTIFPYFVKTGLFAGIRTRFNFILPVLTSEFVAKSTIEAIRTNQEVLFLPRILLLPMPVLRYFGYMFGAHGAMMTFTGREEEV